MKYAKPTTALILLTLFIGCTGTGNVIIMSETAKNGDTVQVHYTGKLENGEVFDSSYERGEPLSFQVGSGQMIKGFDAGVVGMSIGEKKTITIEAKDAYGEYDPLKVLSIKKEELSGLGVEPEVGMTLSANGVPVKIVEINGDEVKMDFNHFLAGKTLIFEIEMVKIN